MIVVLLFFDNSRTEYELPDPVLPQVDELFGGACAAAWHYDGPDGRIVALTPPGPVPLAGSLQFFRPDPMPDVTWWPTFGEASRVLRYGVALVGLDRDSRPRSLTQRERAAIWQEELPASEGLPRFALTWTLPAAHEWSADGTFVYPT